MTEHDNPAGGFSGLRVMVIDDSKTIRRTAETLLKRDDPMAQAALDELDAAIARLAEEATVSA